MPTGYPFRRNAALHAGAARRHDLKARPWQKRFIRAVYKTDKMGNRLVRTAVFSVARKQGKTQLAAALCLAHLCGPEAEQSAANVIRLLAQGTKPSVSLMRWLRSSRAYRG